jgi:hypothetical protein
MIKTLHAILTDSKKRSTQQVKKSLIENNSAGTPWFGKNIVKTDS